MRETVTTPVPSESLRQPDVSVAVAVGLYVTALLAPGLVGLFERTGDFDAATIYVAFLVVSTSLLVGTALSIRRVRGLSERLGGTRLSWALPVVAIPVGTAYALTGPGGGPIASGLGVLGMMTSTVGFFLGLLIRTMAHSRYTGTVLADAPAVAEWTAGWPERQRHLAGLAAAGLMLFGLLAFVADVLPGGLVVEVLGAIGYFVGSVLFGFGRPWTYRVTDRGLERSLAVYRTLIEWDQLSGFETTEETLRIHRRSWWRPTIRCGWSEIEDREAAVDALSRYLDSR